MMLLLFCVVETIIYVKNVLVNNFHSEIFSLCENDKLMTKYKLCSKKGLDLTTYYVI